MGVRVGVAAFAFLVLAGAALAATAQPASTTSALSQPLTPEATRDLVSRLSDEDVRKLLIEQLDRASAPAAQPQAGMAMMGAMGESAVMWRTRVAEIGRATLDLPATIASAFGRLFADTAPALPILVLVAMMAVGAIAEYAWHRATRAWRARQSDVRGEGFFEDALRRATGLAVDFAGIVVFAAGALAVFFVMWHGHAGRRNFALALVGALLVVRVVTLLARFLLSPSRPAQRLLPFPDDGARALTVLAATMAALYAFGVVLGHTLIANGVDARSVDAFGMVVGTLAVAVMLYAIWRVRGPIAAMIRGDGGGSLRRWLADLWPIAASVYVLVIYAGRVREVVTGERGVTGGGILSLLILIVIPILDYALCRALAATAARTKLREGDQATRFIAAYESVLRKMIHIAVVALGLLWLADLWNLDLFTMAQKSLGGRLASSLLGISLVLLIAYMLWEMARTAIDRRLAVERAGPLDTPASRLRTLLPLLRATLLITIIVMATLSVLAALGVDILPLLAGAGVVGVAVGFGSQTLVRDIVSGAFFLMDDAFRLGEYIEVGQAKGRIEKIAVRALFLRHHRGAINVLPYGEIKQLRNTSRDWMIMVMEFRLAFDTDLKKVKKILKAIGEEIKADPELGPDLLQPLKSQGVMSTDDSALVVRAKYMARPGNAPFMIRRVAYEKILKAFAEQGVEFASRRVAVYVPPGAGEEERKRAAAAAIANEPADPHPKAAD